MRDSWIFDSNYAYFWFCFVINVILGYFLSLLLLIPSSYVRKSLALRYHIKEIDKVSAIRFITLGMLFAASFASITGTHDIQLIQFPLLLLLAFTIDYLLSRATLKNYPTKIIIKLTLFSNIIVLIPCFLFCIWFSFLK